MNKSHIKIYKNSELENSLKSRNSVVYHILPASNKHIYSKNIVNENIWEIIELWIKNRSNEKNINKLYESLRKEDQEVSQYFLKDLVNEQLNFKMSSFINFVRYYPILIRYVSKDNYNIAIVDENIRLRISHNSVSLVMHFRTDFLVDFYSYDEDVSDEESLVYSMKGSFSSSSKIRKSYKIERLLSLFDRCIDEFSNLNTYSLISNK